MFSGITQWDGSSGGVINETCSQLQAEGSISDNSVNRVDKVDYIPW